MASIRSLNACDPQRLFTDEIRAIVECEMLTMPQVTRQVFELSRFCGKTYAEIAEALGISQRRVTSEMQRALAIMRNALKDYLPVSLSMDAECLIAPVHSLSQVLGPFSDINLWMQSKNFFKIL